MKRKTKSERLMEEASHRCNNPKLEPPPEPRVVVVSLATTSFPKPLNER